MEAIRILTNLDEESKLYLTVPVYEQQGSPFINYECPHSLAMQFAKDERRLM